MAINTSCLWNRVPIRAAVRCKKTIDIPVLLSQKSHTDQWFRGAGCAVTAGIMAAAYHDNTIYNIHSFDGTAPASSLIGPKAMVTFGGETPRGWCFVEDGNVTKYPSDAETVAYIKSIIDMDIPPICHCPTLDGHWMLAYGYTSGSTFDDIKIVDPADGTRKDAEGGHYLKLWQQRVVRRHHTYQKGFFCALITNNSITGRLEKRPPCFDVSRICLYENRQSANHNQFSPCG